jgi:DnaJ-class molecular chaperone
MSQRKDYYKILGLSRDADARDVRRAYKRLAVAHHPDKAAPSERAAREEQFKEVAEAYEVLRDEEKRAAYDRGDDLDGGGGGGGGWQGGWGGGGPGFQGGGGTWTFTF